MHKGQYLKVLIKQKGFSQDLLASGINYTQSTLSRLLNKSNPDEKSVLAILNHLGISLDEFNTGLGKFNPEGIREIPYSDLIEFKTNYVNEKEDWLIEKDRWLTEKERLLNKQEKLQEENNQLRDELRDKEE